MPAFLSGFIGDIGGIIGGNLVFLSDVFIILQNVFETNITVIGLVPYHLESY